MKLPNAEDPLERFFVDTFNLYVMHAMMSVAQMFKKGGEE
jgi:hypothetical protein